jgi:predicted HicB family RNase H-like nuclease
MRRSESLDRAIKKYEKEKIDRILLRVPKGKREIMQQHAATHGESLNAFINRAVDEAMERKSK